MFYMNSVKKSYYYCLTAKYIACLKLFRKCKYSPFCEPYEICQPLLFVSSAWCFLESAYAYVGVSKSSQACKTIIALVQWIELNSAYHLVAITAIRYISITKPLKYHIWLTERNTMFCIIIIWISTCVIPTSFYASTAADTQLGLCRFEAVYPPQNALFLCFGTMVIPGVIMVTLYFFIIRIARKQARQIIAIEKSLGIANGKCSIFRREMKSAMAVSLLVGWFVIAWSPLLIYIIYSTVCKCESNLYVRTTCRLIVYTNYAVNVFIYSGRMKEFRKCVGKDFWCLCDKVKGLSIELSK